MTDKEMAEEWVKENMDCCKTDNSVNQPIPYFDEEERCCAKSAFQDGAEFGYNKAKEELTESLENATEIIELMKDLFFACWQESGYKAIKFEQRVNDFLKGATLPCETNCKIQVKDEWHKITDWEDNSQFPNDESKTYLVRLYCYRLERKCIFGGINEILTHYTDIPSHNIHNPAHSSKPGYRC